jgi:preprotein translocase subunit SecD
VRGSGRLWLSLVFVGVMVVLALSQFALGQKPLLGLDLKGGLSVTLQGPPTATKSVMEETVNRIRDRVDALGVAEPDISLVGSNVIQVQLPGVSAGTVTKKGNRWCVTSTSGKEVGCFTSQSAANAKAQLSSQQNLIQLIGKTARLEQRPVLQVVAPGGSSTASAGQKAVPFKDITFSACVTDPNATSCPAKANVWTYYDANKNGVFDDGTESKYEVGPVVITGANLKKVSAQYLSASQLQGGTPGWRVTFSLDKDGSAAFGKATTKLAALYSSNPSSPPVTAQLAILVDKVIVSSPVVQQAITSGSGEITGGFSESEAKDLAVVLQSGSLPVSLKQLTVETVSATLGKASLREGVLAGLVGLLALMLYLAFYYRLLGLVTWLGMAIWATLAFGLITFLGITVNYALTLAGVAGIIVSLGITADSYIVFYERLKDEIRHGKTVRAAVQPAFKRAWRTIVAADTVTVIAAAVLYLVSIGSVRGFALTLGLSTLLDLFVVWFYKRPTVFLMARSPRLVDMPVIGLRAAVAVEMPEPVAASGARPQIAGASK